MHNREYKIWSRGLSIIHAGGSYLAHPVMNMWPTQQHYPHAANEGFDMQTIHDSISHMNPQHHFVAGSYQGAETWWSMNPQQYFPVGNAVQYGSLKAVSQPMPYMHTPKLQLWPNTSHLPQQYAAQGIQDHHRLPISRQSPGFGEPRRTYIFSRC